MSADVAGEKLVPASLLVKLVAQAAVSARREERHNDEISGEVFMYITVL